MQLKLGKMTGKEIAEWFGISYNRYSHTRRDKLNYLSNFCEFVEYRGGVEITKVLIPHYIKNLSDDDIVYLKEVMQAKNHLTSLSGMERKMAKNNNPISYYRLSQAGERTFGITNDIENPGIYGSRKYVWAIKLDDYNNYRFRTPEEDEIYYNILSEYCNSAEGIEFTEQAALLRRAYKKGEINSEEYLKASIADDDNFYTKVIERFQEQTGYLLVCATEHEVLESQKERIQELLSK